MEIKNEKTKVMLMECKQTSGCDDDNNKSEENKPISPKLMRILTKHTCTSNGPYPIVEKVSRTIRKKRPQYMCEAQRASNILYISIKVQGIRLTEMMATHQSQV